MKHIFFIFLSLFIASTVACTPEENDPSDTPGWQLENNQTADMTQDIEPDQTSVDMEKDTPNDMPLRQCPGTRTLLTSPTTVSERLLPGEGNIDEHSCSPGQGTEHTYTLHIRQAKAVRIWTTYLNQETTFAPVITLKKGCDGGVDLYCSAPLQTKPNSDYNGFIQAYLEPGNYRLTLDSRSNDPRPPGGQYTLHIEDAQLTDNAQCTNARRLDPDEVVEKTFGLDGTSGDQRTCFRHAYHAHYYSVNVPPFSAISATATIEDRQSGPSLQLYNECEQTKDTCKTGHSQQGKVTAANPTNMTRRMILAVTGNEGKTYKVSTQITALEPNGQCAQALELNSGQTVTNQDFDAGSPRAPICNGDFRRTLYYKINVPAQHRLLTYGVPLERAETCNQFENQMCLSDGIINQSNTDKTYYLRAFDYQHKPFEITAITAPLASNAFCATPTKLTLDQTLKDQDLRQGGEEFNPCNAVSIDKHFTRYYTLDFTLGETPSATVRIIPHDMNNLSATVQVLDNRNDDCANAKCVRVDDAYFRSAPIAKVVAGYSDVGVGQSTVTVLIAINMAKPNESNGSALFDIEVTSN